MFDETTRRYTRQMTLPQLGEDGQLALQEAHVLILGLGGLGSPAAMYLAAAGVGTLTLCDYDRVDLSNLHRQILYSDAEVGQRKTSAAAAKLRAVNPRLEVHTEDRRLDAEALAGRLGGVDVVLDCSDNFATRHTVNKACVSSATPLISGAGIRLEGQVSLFNATPSSPCYACLYPEGEEQAERCADVGVLGPVVGVIGSLQALEAIKLIAEIGDTLDGRVLVLDGQAMQWRSLALKKDPRCPVCG